MARIPSTVLPASLNVFYSCVDKRNVLVLLNYGPRIMGIANVPLDSK